MEEVLVDMKVRKVKIDFIYMYIYGGLLYFLFIEFWILKDGKYLRDSD